MAQQELKRCVTMCILSRTQQFPIHSEGTKSREVAQYFEKFSELKVAGTKSRGTESRGILMSRMRLGTVVSLKKTQGYTTFQLLLSH